MSGPPRRMTIVGPGGAGKSTLTARRGRATAGRPLGPRWRTAAWVLRYRARHRPLVLRNLAEHAAGKRVRIARSAADVERLLREAEGGRP